MPLYTYVCHCGNVEEQLNSIEDRDNAGCNQCGNVMRRIIQAPRIVSTIGEKAYSKAPPLIKKFLEDANQ